MLQLAHRPLRRLARVAFAATLTVASGLALAAARPATLRFNPPNNTTYTETFQLQSALDVAEQARRDRASLQLATRNRKVIRKTATGFTLASTRLSSASMQNGRPSPNALDTALNGVTVTYELDASGKVKNVRGLDVVAARLNKALPKGKGAAVTEASLKQKLTQEWTARVGSLLGKQVTPGSVKTSIEPFPVGPKQAVPVYTVERVLLRPKVGGHTCLQLRSDYDTDPRALSKATKVSVTSLLAAAKGKALSPAANVRVTGYTEVTLDPATLLFYSQSSARAVTLGAGKQPASVGAERQGYTFAYGK